MNFDAAEEIGLRARHAIEQRRTEMRLFPENVGVGVKTHRGAAPVLYRAEVLELRLRLAAAVFLRPQLTVARHLDGQFVGQRIDYRDADAVQPARCLVGIAAELAAGMQHRQYDLQRRLGGELGMGVDRDAAAVVAYREGVVDRELDLDPAGMAGDGFVHRVVDDFGGKMVKGTLVGAANVHAWPPAHRLEPFEYFDVLGRIARRRLAGEIVEEICHGAIIESSNQPRQAAYGTRR